MMMTLALSLRQYAVVAAVIRMVEMDAVPRSWVVESTSLGGVVVLDVLLLAVAVVVAFVSVMVVAVVVDLSQLVAVVVESAELQLLAATVVVVAE